MHWIQALIAPRDVFADIREALPAAVVRHLPQNLCLVPLTDEFVAGLSAAGWAQNDPPSLPAEEMPPGACAFAADASRKGPVVFVATYIHGGTGGQDAMVWKEGNLVKTFHEDEESMSSWPNSSISKALREIGVVARAGEDEFDAIGLGTHRSTEKWAESNQEVFPATLPVQVSASMQPNNSQKPWWKFWE